MTRLTQNIAVSQSSGRIRNKDAHRNPLMIRSYSAPWSWLFAPLWIFVVFVYGSPLAADTVPPIDGIEDNSFLVEEAYNQEPGVVQHIFTTIYGEDRDNRPRRRGWDFGFTQEWPVFSQRHQFSYTIPFSFAREGGAPQDGIGDLLLNYRLQVLEERGWLPAFAPRFSLIVPTGSRDDGTGNGVVGFQWNLPFSKKLGPRFAMHANAGLTYLPDTRVSVEEDTGGETQTRLSPEHSLVSYNLGASGIVALSPHVHCLLEWVGIFAEELNSEGRKEHDFSTVISPGVRAAVVNTKDMQVVFGVAAPVGLTRPATDYGIFLYLSVEHNFL